MPHVGAKSHDTGWSQPGSTATGISKPEIIHTGHSKRLPSMNADRYRTSADAKRKPRLPIAPIAAGTATANATQSWIVIATPKNTRTYTSPIASEYTPIAEIATVIGRTTAQNGVGDGDEQLEDPHAPLRLQCARALRGRRRPDAHHA